jgi:two-component system, NarL family, sensor kinase
MTDPAHLALHARLDELLQRHEELNDRLHDGQRRFQRLARSVWRVQEEERRRFARELHDGIGQNLTALLRLIAQIEGGLPPGADAARDTLRQTLALAESTWQDTRTLSRLLRPQILDDLGLEPALRWLGRSLSGDGGPTIDLDLTGLPELDGELSTLVFRVVQEALSNAVRHGQATRISVRVSRRANLLRIRVLDDGRGCTTDAAWASGSSGRSSGLGGMRDRVQLFDGEIRIESEPGHGFKLLLELPLPDEGHSSP